MTNLSKRELMRALWKCVVDEISVKYFKTVLTHEQAEYIENEGLGCNRLEEIDINADDYNPEETETIEISVWDYIEENFEKDFFDYINTDDLGEGKKSSEELEDFINESVDELYEFFRTFTVVGDITIEINGVEYTGLEDLHPEWTDDEYYLDDEKMEDFIDEIQTGVGITGKMTDLINTFWKIDLGDDVVSEITLLNNGTLKSINIDFQNEDYNLEYMEGEEHTWDLNDLLITISFNKGFLVLTGKMESNSSINGKYKNNWGAEGKWSGKLISEAHAYLPIFLKNPNISSKEFQKLISDYDLKESKIEKLGKHISEEVLEEKAPDENQTYYLKFKNRVTVIETVSGFICWFNFLKALREHSSWDEYVMSKYDFFKFDDIYHHYGTEGIADTLVNPDGTEEPFKGCNIIEDQNADTKGTAGNPENYGSFGEFLTAHAYREGVQLEIAGPFIHVANSHEEGTWKTYEVDKDEFYVEEIDFGKIEAINSAGVITKYVYDNEYELPDNDLVSTETSNIQCQLFIAGGKQTEPLDFEAIKQDLLKMKLDIRKDDDIKIYLVKKFGIETNTEWFIL